MVDLYHRNRHSGFAAIVACVYGVALTAFLLVVSFVIALCLPRTIAIPFVFYYSASILLGTLMAIRAVVADFIDADIERVVLSYEIVLAVLTSPLALVDARAWVWGFAAVVAGGELYRLGIDHDISMHAQLETVPGASQPRVAFYTSGLAGRLSRMAGILLIDLFVVLAFWSVVTEGNVGLMLGGIFLLMVFFDATLWAAWTLPHRRRWVVIEAEGIGINSVFFSWPDVISVRRYSAFMRNEFLIIEVTAAACRRYREEIRRGAPVVFLRLLWHFDWLDRDRPTAQLRILDFYCSPGQLRQIEAAIAERRPELVDRRRSSRRV